MANCFIRWQAGFDRRYVDGLEIEMDLMLTVPQLVLL